MLVMRVVGLLFGRNEGVRDLLVGDIRCEACMTVKATAQKCHLLKILQSQRHRLIFLRLRA